MKEERKVKMKKAVKVVGGIGKTMKVIFSIIGIIAGVTVLVVLYKVIQAIGFSVKDFLHI